MLRYVFDKPIAPLLADFLREQELSQAFFITNFS
jgi:hypothetical protein